MKPTRQPPENRRAVSTGFHASQIFLKPQPLFSSRYLREQTHTAPSPASISPQNSPPSVRSFFEESGHGAGGSPYRARGSRPEDLLNPFFRRFGSKTFMVNRESWIVDRKMSFSIHYPLSAIHKYQKHNRSTILR